MYRYYNPLSMGERYSATCVLIPLYIWQDVLAGCICSTIYISGYVAVVYICGGSGLVSARELSALV
jgi:hypothetical protein